MIDFDAQELIGLYESIDDNEEKKSGLKEQIKMVDADSKEKYETFAKEKEADITNLKDGYKHYKKVHSDGEASDELYTIMAKVDEGLSEGTETEAK